MSDLSSVVVSSDDDDSTHLTSSSIRESTDERSIGRVMGPAIRVETPTDTPRLNVSFAPVPDNQQKSTIFVPTSQFGASNSMAFNASMCASMIATDRGAASLSLRKIWDKLTERWENDDENVEAWEDMEELYAEAKHASESVSTLSELIDHLNDKIAGLQMADEDNKLAITKLEEKLRVEQKQWNQRLNEALSEIDENAALIAKKSETKTISRAKPKAAGDLDQLWDDFNEAQEQISDLKSQRQNLKKEIGELKSTVAGNAAKIAEMAEVREQYEMLKGRNQKTIARVEELEREREELEQELEESEQQAETLEELVAERDREIMALKGRLESFLDSENLPTSRPAPIIVEKAPAPPPAPVARPTLSRKTFAGVSLWKMPAISRTAKIAIIEMQPRESADVGTLIAAPPTATAGTATTRVDTVEIGTSTPTIATIDSATLTKTPKEKKLPEKLPEKFIPIRAMIRSSTGCLSIPAEASGGMHLHFHHHHHDHSHVHQHDHLHDYGALVKGLNQPTQPPLVAFEALTNGSKIMGQLTKHSTTPPPLNHSNISTAAITRVKARRAKKESTV